MNQRDPLCFLPLAFAIVLEPNALLMSKPGQKTLPNPDTEQDQAHQMKPPPTAELERQPKKWPGQDHRRLTVAKKEPGYLVGQGVERTAPELWTRLRLLEIRAGSRTVCSVGFLSELALLRLPSGLGDLIQHRIVYTAGFLLEWLVGSSLPGIS